MRIRTIKYTTKGTLVTATNELKSTKIHWSEHSELIKDVNDTDLTPPGGVIRVPPGGSGCPRGGLGTPWGRSGYPPRGGQVPPPGGPGTPPGGYPAGGTLPPCWGGLGTPPGGVPCQGDPATLPGGGCSYLCGVQAATELFCCELALYSLMPHEIMGNVAKHHGSKKKKKKLWDGYPPCGQTDWWMDRHVSKHYLPVVLRTRAVTNQLVFNTVN